MRQFFIIGHNPNRVVDAINYLQAGANAIEPDIHFVNGICYVGEGTTSTDLTLTDYLEGLSSILDIHTELIPSLITFDTKNSTGDIKALFENIQTNFSNKFKDTVIFVTRSQATEEEYVFFEPSVPTKYALGIDEHTEPEFVDAFFKSMNVPNYTYADGISIQVPLLADLYLDRIKRAITMRDKGNSFKLVYSWTIDESYEIESFLKLNPDGLITDSPSNLKEIITTKFSTQYQIAKLGYNPF